MNSSDHSDFWQIKILLAIFRGVSVVIVFECTDKLYFHISKRNKKGALDLLIGSCHAFNNLSD